MPLSSVAACCLSKQKAQAQSISKKIDRQLRLERKRIPHEIKLLLLGCAGSGKSTFIKQMRILYGDVFSDEDKRGLARVVHRNVFTAAQALIRAMSELQIPYEQENNKANARLVSEVDVEGVTILTNPYLGAIKSLWSDAGVRECFSRKREYQLLDSAKYFLDDLDRIGDTFYLPTERDILRARELTKRFTEYSFTAPPSVWPYRLVDVRGQSTESQKWFQCFSEFQGVLFLVSVSDYDQVLAGENRLAESLAFFQAIRTSCWLARVKLIVLLNKVDLLAEKIQHSHLVDYFPEYAGPRCDPEAAKHFIANLFSRDDDMLYNRIHVQFICATDTESVRTSFNVTADLVKPWVCPVCGP